MNSVIQKQEFQNQTGGWLGVVVIGPKGDERGASVEPNGSVWLTEAEQILTANAPRRAEDNPFIPQSFTRIDPDSGEKKTVEVTPLVPVNTGRFVPSQTRPIGAAVESDTAAVQRAAEEAAQAERERQVVEAAGKKDSWATDDELEELRTPPEETAPAPEPPAPSARAAAAAKAAAASEPSTPPAAPEQPASAPVEAPAPEPTPEETAVEQPPAEHQETGAALPPSGEAVAGTFAAGEEVGTPVQADETAADEETGAETGQPAPFVPPTEE